jgi:hypothetical protein
MKSIPDLSDFQSLSGSSAGTLSRQPSLRSRAADDAAISNQTIAYPGDPLMPQPKLVVVRPCVKTFLHSTGLAIWKT